MSEYGVAWSLLAAAAVATGAIFAVRPAFERPGVLTDRMLVGGGLALLLSRSVTVALTDLDVADVAAGYGSDLEFWFVATATLAWTVRAPRPERWRKARGRILELTPSVLLAYGTYVVLCPLRQGCADGSGALLIRMAVAVALVALALTLHFVWIIAPAERLLMALTVLAGGRSVLGLSGPDGALGEVALSVALLGIGASALAWSLVRWKVSGRGRRRIAEQSSSHRNRTPKGGPGS